VSTLKRISLLLALGACLGTTGCGSDDEGGRQIPADTAAALERQLDNVQDRLNNGSVGACEDILEGPRGPNRDAVQQLVEGLPEDVDPDVRDALQQSFDNLWELVQGECDERAPDEPPETESTPLPTPTETETETEPTETTPPPTDTTTNPEDAPLPNDGDGNGNGNGNGGGNGGGGDSGGAVPDTGDISGGVGPSKLKDKGKVTP
jgi:hypothetical protein